MTNSPLSLTLFFFSSICIFHLFLWHPTLMNITCLQLPRHLASSCKWSLVVAAALGNATTRCPVDVAPPEVCSDMQNERVLKQAHWPPNHPPKGRNLPKRPKRPKRYKYSGNHSSWMLQTRQDTMSSKKFQQNRLSRDLFVRLVVRRDRIRCIISFTTEKTDPL